MVRNTQKLKQILYIKEQNSINIQAVVDVVNYETSIAKTND